MVSPSRLCSALSSCLNTEEFLRSTPIFNRLASPEQINFGSLPEGCSPCLDPGSRQQSVTFCDPFPVWLLLLFPGLVCNMF